MQDRLKLALVVEGLDNGQILSRLQNFHFAKDPMSGISQLTDPQRYSKHCTVSRHVICQSAQTIFYSIPCRILLFVMRAQCTHLSPQCPAVVQAYQTRVQILSQTS